MRGFRPSYFNSRTEDMSDELERIKRANMERYMRRVEEGLPVFENDGPIFVEGRPHPAANSA